MAQLVRNQYYLYILSKLFKANPIVYSMSQDIGQEFPRQGQFSTPKKQISLHMEQVSGKSPKFLLKDQSKLLKAYDTNQYMFYSHLQAIHVSHPHAAIAKYLPICYGHTSFQQQPQIVVGRFQNDKNTQQWLRHLTARYSSRVEQNKFIVLQNLTHEWQAPNVFDIKIGAKGKQHKKGKPVGGSGIRLNGCRINFTKLYQKGTGSQQIFTQRPQSLFLSKYYLKEAFQLDQILNYFALFFYNGYTINVQTLLLIQQQLADLILRFKALKGYRFVASSVCFFYDAKATSKAIVRLIDFGRITKQHPDYFDDQAYTKLVHIHRLLSTLLQRNQQMAKKAQELRQAISLADITVIPQNKKEKQAGSLTCFSPVSSPTKTIKTKTTQQQISPNKTQQ